MLLVVERGREAEVQRVFQKWELDAVPIGRVTADGVLRARMRGEVVAEVPVRALTDEAPVYDRPRTRPGWLQEQRTLDFRAIPEPRDPGAVLVRLLAAPTIASKRSIWRQYDHQVGINTLVLPGSDAAVLRIKGTPARSRWPPTGTAATGSSIPSWAGRWRGRGSAQRRLRRRRPLAVTNCLNPPPERPEIMWQFAETVDGIAAACDALGIPVTGGNVSFYNETLGRGSCPRPSSASSGCSRTRAADDPVVQGGGDVIVLLGDPRPAGGSEYLQTVHGRLAGVPAHLDLDRERSVQAACVAAIEAGCVRSAHDAADGGSPWRWRSAASPARAGWGRTSRFPRRAAWTRPSSARRRPASSSRRRRAT
jgi:phosphoribosylformylglycinamidine synthase